MALCHLKASTSSRVRCCVLVLGVTCRSVSSCKAYSICLDIRILAWQLQAAQTYVRGPHACKQTDVLAGRQVCSPERGLRLANCGARPDVGGFSASSTHSGAYVGDMQLPSGSAGNTCWAISGCMVVLGISGCSCGGKNEVGLVTQVGMGQTSFAKQIRAKMPQQNNKPQSNKRKVLNYLGAAPVRAAPAAVSRQRIRGAVNLDTSQVRKCRRYSRRKGTNYWVFLAKRHEIITKFGFLGKKARAKSSRVRARSSVF